MMKHFIFIFLISLSLNLLSYAQITSTPTSFWSLSNGTSRVYTAWWDVTGDNYDDVAIGTSYSGYAKLSVIRNNGTSLWSYTSGNSEAALWLDYADMDNDNDKDLAVAAGNRTWAFKDNGSTLSSTPDWEISTSNAHCVAWGNYNNDNYMDLAVAVSGYVYIYNGTYGGTLNTSPNWSYNIGGGTVLSLSFGRLTEGSTFDDKQSLAIGIKNTGVYVFENTGSTLPSSASWSNTSADAAVFADFNNDNVEDICTNYSSGNTDARVYLGDAGSISTTYYNANFDE
jgi:hypothetical protein